MKVWKIYKITNRTSGRSYVGLTSKPLARRFKEHVDEAYHGVRRHRNGTRYAIHAALIKYGVENFTIEEIHSQLSLDEGREREIYYIKKYNSYASNANLPNMPRGYNETPGGEIPDSGELAFFASLQKTEATSKAKESQRKPKKFSNTNLSPEVPQPNTIVQEDTPPDIHRAPKSSDDSFKPSKKNFSDLYEYAIGLVGLIGLLVLIFNGFSSDTQVNVPEQPVAQSFGGSSSVQETRNLTQQPSETSSREQSSVTTARDSSNQADRSFNTSGVRPTTPSIRALDVPDVVIPAQREANTNRASIDYPRRALERGITGVVTLTIEVESTGRVGSVDVAQSAGHSILDRSAIDHVRTQWQYSPQMRNGVSETSTVTARIRFELP